MATLDKADSLKLYELIVAEEHFNSEAYHKGISFYTGLLFALYVAHSLRTRGS